MIEWSFYSRCPTFSGENSSGFSWSHWTKTCRLEANVQALTALWLEFLCDTTDGVDRISIPTQGASKQCMPPSCCLCRCTKMWLSWVRQAYLKLLARPCPVLDASRPHSFFQSWVEQKQANDDIRGGIARLKHVFSLSISITTSSTIIIIIIINIIIIIITIITITITIIPITITIILILIILLLLLLLTLADNFLAAHLAKSWTNHTKAKDLLPGPTRSRNQPPS